MALRPAAIGAAPHSGWAALVALGNAALVPSVLARCRIEMADAREPDSKQPYHALESLELEQARRRLKAFSASALTNARAALEQMMSSLEQQGYRVHSLGILDSSGRTSDSLKAILASHALIHTADGNHFRSAIAVAAAQCGLQVHRIAAKALEEHAHSALKLSPDEIRQTLVALGKQVGAPWGADQKNAALLAWTQLSVMPIAKIPVTR
jgi:hypothetical protein